MAAWLSIIKTVVPLVAPVVQAAVPAFTKNKQNKEGQDAITAQQIEELQSAVKSNNEFVKALASALEESAKVNDMAVKRLRLITTISLVLSILASVVAIISMA